MHHRPMKFVNVMVTRNFGSVATVAQTRSFIFAVTLVEIFSITNSNNLFLSRGKVWRAPTSNFEFQVL